MENHNHPARSDDSIKWQGGGPNLDQAALSAGLERDIWADSSHHAAGADCAHSSPVGAELGQLFSKFTRQGNVMTDADWNAFGKIFLDFASDPDQATRPREVPAHHHHHHPGTHPKHNAATHFQTEPNARPADITAGHPQPVAQAQSTDLPPRLPAQGKDTGPPRQSVVQPQDTIAPPQMPAQTKNTDSPTKLPAQAKNTDSLPQPAVQPQGTDQPLTTPSDRVAPPAVSDQSGEINFPSQHGPVVKGSEFFRDVLHASSDNPKLRGLTGAEREKAILKQVEAGNIPDFLRHPKEITVTDKSGNTAVMKVMPDYLAIGTNDDFVRVPVTPVLAKTIAEKYGLALPTKKVVDDIYQNADIRLTGQGLVHDMSDTKYMDGNGFYLKHNKKISDQLAGKPQDALVAGHKKDIIVSKYAQNNPDRLDFYGLFDKDGHAIQGAHGGPHENTYVDYSHGARFICQDMVVNGKHMTYDQVLKDKQLSGLLSDEGPVQTASIYKQPKYPDYMEVA